MGVVWFILVRGGKRTKGVSEFYYAQLKTKKLRNLGSPVTKLSSQITFF